MTDQNLALIDSLENFIEEQELQQPPLGKLVSQHGQFNFRWNHQHSENIGFKGVTYKQFYFEYHIDVEKWTRANINHPPHGLIFDIFSFSNLFGNESYIERNKTVNELYIYEKIGYGTKSDSIMGTSIQNILPVPYIKVGTDSSDVYVTS